MNPVEKGVHWAGGHPVPLALGVFAIGAIWLLVFHKRTTGDNGMSAFYAAQAAQAASGNGLAATQAQAKAALGIAQVAASRDVSIAGISSSTATTLGGYSKDVALAQETTAQQGQKQQFWLATGQQQIEGQAMPWFIDQFRRGGDGGAEALAAWQTLIAAGSNYHPAH